MQNSSFLLTSAFSVAHASEENSDSRTTTATFIIFDTKFLVFNTQFPFQYTIPRFYSHMSFPLIGIATGVRAKPGGSCSAVTWSPQNSSFFNGRILIFYCRIIEESSFCVEESSFSIWKRTSTALSGLTTGRPKIVIFEGKNLHFVDWRIFIYALKNTHRRWIGHPTCQPLARQSGIASCRHKQSVRNHIVEGIRHAWCKIPRFWYTIPRF